MDDSTVSHVIGPNGSPLSLADLPRPNTNLRWTVGRKTTLIRAVRAGLLSVGDARNRYNLSLEKLLSWQEGLNQHGFEGLKVTKSQVLLSKYRR